MESFNAMVRRLWAGDAASTTDALFEELGLTEEQGIILHAPVRDRVWHRYRYIAKQAEEVLDKAPEPQQRSHDSPDSHEGAAHSALRPASGTGTVIRRKGPMPDLNDPLAFLNAWVPLPGRGYEGGGRLWRDMTVADHGYKIDVLQRHMSGLSNAIDRHVWAQNEIFSHGVRTLGEIDPESLRKDIAGLQPEVA